MVKFKKGARGVGGRQAAKIDHKSDEEFLEELRTSSLDSKTKKLILKMLPETLSENESKSFKCIYALI